MEEKILYLCNGEKPDCNKRGCFRNGGDCWHTANPEYAVNFRRKHPHGILWERLPYEKPSLYDPETAEEITELP